MSNQNLNLPNEFLSSSKIKAFKCAEHSVNIAMKLQTFYEQKEFFDIVLIAGIDNTKVQAHRLVLSASSDYFLAMSRSTLMEATADEVEIKEIDGVTLKLVLDFMYTASIELRNDIVESVLRAADFFQIQTLITACCDFMGEQLDVSNCLGIAMFADQHNYLALETKSLEFACKHFEQVCNDKEFLLLNKEQLKKFITADDRCVRSEEKLFLNVVEWIEYDKDREQHIFDIISLLRFKLLQPKFIIENRHSICKTIECYELTYTWLQRHTSVQFRDQQETNEKLAFTTGIQNSNLQIWTFKSEKNVWLPTNIPRTIENRFDCLCVIAINKILVAGGSVRDYYGGTTSYVTCLDLDNKLWFDLPAMKQKLNIKLMVELNGELYVFDCNNPNGQKLVEKYNFYTRQWQIIVSPPINLITFQVAALGKFLYIVYDGYSNMHCYDPVKNKWIDKARKKVVMENFGIAAVCGHLYTVGGISNGKDCHAVERYNPSDDTWTVIDLKVHGGATQCTSFNDQLIIYCEESSGRNVMEYYPRTNETKILRAMPHTNTKKYLLTTY